MVKYLCDRCEKIFNRKSSYDNHINRKYKCDIVVKDDKTCNHCNKKFSRKDGVARHKKYNCKYVSIKPKKKLNKAKVINIENCNIINIINIKLVKYGEEDLSFITKEDYINIIEKGFNSVLKLISFVHFNNNKPEYHNVCVSNKKSKFASIVGDDGWDLTNKKELIDNIYNDKFDHLEDIFDELEPELSEKEKRGFNNFRKERNNKNVSKKSKEDIEIYLFNKRKMVIETIKMIKKKNQSIIS